jgi:hypothetical protein
MHHAPLMVIEPGIEPVQAGLPEPPPFSVTDDGTALTAGKKPLVYVACPRQSILVVLSGFWLAPVHPKKMSIAKWPPHAPTKKFNTIEILQSPQPTFVIGSGGLLPHWS